MSRTFYLFAPTLYCLFLFSCIQGQNSLTQLQVTGGAGEITVEKVKKLIESNANFTLLDTRSKKEYDQSHLPTALSMPACDDGEYQEQLPEEKDQPLILYCGWPTCSMNIGAASVARDEGYMNIIFMKEGVEGWIKAGFLTIAADSFVLTGSCILIDLRASRKNTVQRIPGSISIPLATLIENVSNLSRNAVIVVYSDHYQESCDALFQLQSAGFSSVSMVAGNFQGWKKRNRPITSGPIQTAVQWKTTIETGEVSLVDFNNALNEGIDAVFLDVRTNEEVATGTFSKKALHIPLEELISRKNELPRGKKIFIYSSTGPRADMAGRLLKKNGYTAVLALHATLKCGGGSCTFVD